MTPEKIELVQGSFKKVAPIAETAADIFYDRLFEIAPEVRPLFPAQMKDQNRDNRACGAGTGPQTCGLRRQRRALR